MALARPPHRQRLVTPIRIKGWEGSDSSEQFIQNTPGDHHAAHGTGRVRRDDGRQDAGAIKEQGLVMCGSDIFRHIRKRDCSLVVADQLLDLVNLEDEAATLGVCRALGHQPQFLQEP